ncbi:MAG TPA: SpoIIE family protein phosphatase [Candidatus Cybelea sp.]|jgi:serine phosphatase RsbU (regulator of sigma subunit)|nr:SpoIIE family protein phosphatase [Candidatus Cybelea sp.]
MARRVYLPLALTLCFSAVVIAALWIGGVSVRSGVVSAFDDSANVRTARIRVGDALREQLDEETGVRGYAAVREKILLEPYDEARLTLPLSLQRIGVSLRQLQMTDASQALADAAATSRRWLAVIAVPLISSRTPQRDVQLRGKRLVDRFRSDMNAVEELLAARADRAAQRAQESVLWISLFAACAVLAIILAAAVFAVVQFRLADRLERERARSEEERRAAAEVRAAYETERRIAETLQAGFAQNVLPRLARVRFSATYVPAAEETNIGGDWYDALELSRERVLLAMGDVTGHGIEAAVAMNQTRHLLVACALLDSSPTHVLARVNAELCRSGAPLITALAGVVDVRNFRFAYAAAGHPPPVLWEPGRPARLLDVGSLPLGIVPEAQYQTHVVESVPGALIVLYTDGAVEHSRNVVEGESLLLAAVEAAGQAPSGEAGMIYERIFAGRRIADDVAILTIRFAHENSRSQERAA